MSIVSKEAVYSALWARLTGSVTGTQTTSRRVAHFDDLQPYQMPAMYLEQVSARGEGSPGMPSRETVVANVVIYCHDDGADGPMPAVNGMVSQVQSSLEHVVGESPSTYRTTTLGGAVTSARATAVEYAGGSLGAVGVAVVTVEMLATG